MIDRGSTHENFSPIKKLINYFKFKYQFFRDNPTYFYADGLVCFVGPQGSGKTLSAVNYVYNQKQWNNNLNGTRANKTTN